MQGNICPLTIIANSPGTCNTQCKFRAENGDCNLAQLVSNLQVLTAMKLTGR